MRLFLVTYSKNRWRLSIFVFSTKGGIFLLFLTNDRVSPKKKKKKKKKKS